MTITYQKSCKIPSKQDNFCSENPDSERRSCDKIEKKNKQAAALVCTSACYNWNQLAFIKVFSLISGQLGTLLGHTTEESSDV